METILTARLASITVLTEFDKENRLENRILDELDTRERAQANEYIQGILRRRSFLDFLIAEYSSVPIAEMEATFRNILRLGLYGLLFMDGTPDHAAINEPVEIAKRKISSRSGDMANAILRRAQREREANQLPKPAMPDRIKLIATTFSHPEWLVERYVKRFGEREAFQLFQANNKRPDFYLRVNNLRTKTENFTLRLEKSGIPFEESEWLPGYYKVTSVAEVRAKGWFDKGLCQVQDIAAGFAPTVLDPQPGETVYDLCAAPGTKTIVLADLMQNQGTIHSVDIAQNRIGKIAENAENYGAEIVKIQRADIIEERFKLADAVLLDAPCSGTGVLSKRADLRWRRTPEELTAIIEKQAELLDAAANMVAKGGRLVYTTCSIEPEENMKQVEKFLEEYDNFELQPLDDFLPEEVLAEDFLSYQTLPHVHGCDGHFGVLLKRIK
ncbi:MAG: 16S rRNA (cytosine967-C5)-methyltransferase RsmB [Bacteroidetes bacterium HLUCCA01]|nr:MAG: 16S rRNA (cytosine967-C5)-methyltransferase RsmB [Bacteroidetes bacterium HLUCCA01]